MYRIGLDIGPQTIAGVLVQPPSLEPVAAVQRAAGPGAISAVVRALCPDPSAVDLVAAAVPYPQTAWKARAFEPVVALRVARTARTAAPPFHAWPDDLAVAAGRPGLVCAPTELERGTLVDRLRGQGASAVALTVEDAPSRSAVERSLGARLMQLLPHSSVTLSHTLGSVGLLQRENAAILNAAITKAVTSRLDVLTADLNDARVTAPIYLVRYDGLLADIDYVRRYPVMCMSGRLGAQAHGASLAADVPDGQLLVPAENGFWLAEVREGYPVQSDRHRHLGTVPTSLPQIRTRHVVTASPWVRIGNDDRLLLREAEAATGSSQALAVWSEHPRVLSPAGARRRRLLRRRTRPELAALGAATAVVGCESEVVADEDDPAAEQALVDEVRIRAVAAGARVRTVQVSMISKAPVSHTAPRTGAMRLYVRAVGKPLGSIRQ